MGWRTSHNYDLAEQERLRQLPLHERYAWKRVFLTVLFVVSVVLVFAFRL